ncbi:MAG: gamma-glutamyltransferase [Pseudomonadota bacterium]
MVVGRWRVVLAMLVAGPSAWADAPAPTPSAVASDHGLASACGAQMLERGGNAVDAAVATALCAGVVQPASSGLGGGGFAVVAGPGVAPTVFDFREVAPSHAVADQFVGAPAVRGKPASDEGGLAVAVPTESRGLATLLATFGTLPARVVAAPAIALAEDGFAVQAHLASRLAASKQPEILAWFSKDGRVLVEGDRCVQPQLAATLRRWASSHGEDLASGQGAAAIADHVRATGGNMVAADLAATRVVRRSPLIGTFRGETVVTMPPPSSGGVVVLQTLAVLEPSLVAPSEPTEPVRVHRLVEALQHGFADRAHALGDPDFVTVPVDRLLGASRIEAIRAAFDPSRTLPTEAYGPRLAPPSDEGTQHIAVIDRDGLGVALTTTINQSFGSGLVVPALGIVLNDQMDDFSVAPGVPNGYGLVGSAANAVAPGKRPLSSMSPTLVVDGSGRARLAVGASGGPTIITGTLQVLLASLVDGLAPTDAVALPRVHHQWLPAVLTVEPAMPLATADALAALGHTLERKTLTTSVQIVACDPTVGCAAASDPRKGGAPAGAR